VQQRFVVAGLELVRADQEAIRVFLNLVGDFTAGESVELRLADLLALVFRLTGEGDDGLVRALAFLQVVPLIAWKYWIARWMLPVTTIARA
jgi:hypothetical protein